MKFASQVRHQLSVSFHFFSASLILLWAIGLLCVSSSALAVDAAEIETVMRKYQNKYHYVAAVNSFPNKYLSWPSHGCVAAPSYPVDFYGEVTEQEAEALVNSIVGYFYQTGPCYSNISSYFLEELPEGRESYRTVIVTEPNATESWQNRLAQVSSDIDKLIYYCVGSAGEVSGITKSGYGDDFPVWVGETECGSYVSVNGSFGDALSEAVSAYMSSTSACSPVGVVTYSTRGHSEGTYCNDTLSYSGDAYFAFARSGSIKLQSVLSKHTGTAYCYLKLAPESISEACGSYSATDGIASFNPVQVDEKFHAWGSPAVGQVWTSDYLFDPNSEPNIASPSRIDPNMPGTWWPWWWFVDLDEEECYVAVNEKAWSLSETVVVVVPDFEEESDPAIAWAAPTEKVYKDKDKHIVYSAGQGCGYSSGELVHGRIEMNDYDPNIGMVLEVRLIETFSDKIAQVRLGSGSSSSDIDGNNLNAFYCLGPQQNNGTGTWFVPLSVQSLLGEDNIQLSIATVFSKPLGETASDPNQAQRIKTYRGDGSPVSFRIKTNGYECCNRKETLNAGDDKPQVKKHENGDIEIYFPDIAQSYIWGSMTAFVSPPLPPSVGYSKTCSYLDRGISDYIPEGGSSGQYFSQSAPQSNRLIYAMGSGWLTEDTAANASFAWELDADGNILKAADYDSSGRLYAIRNAAAPDQFYRQFYYADTSNPNRMTGFADYAGQLSRTYALVYDPTSGRLAGTVGGSGSGCGSCASAGESRLYFYDDAGNILTERDTAGSVIYEHQYDAQNRQIAKWLGAKELNKPIRIVDYNDNAVMLGGSRIQDQYDYLTTGDYRFTRQVLDGYGQTVAELAFGAFNINPSAISAEPNEIIASGGYITSYGYNYSGDLLQSITTQTPRFNSGQIDTYQKNILSSSGTSEDQIVVYVDSNSVESEVLISRNVYSYTTSIGRQLAQSHDTRGLEQSKYTTYNYNGRGQLDSKLDPDVTHPDGSLAQLHTSYTYRPDGRIETETVSNAQLGTSGMLTVTTYWYDILGNPAGSEVRDSEQILLSWTKTRCNGFGQPVYSMDSTGVARGKEYDGAGKLVSEFVFAEPNDTTLFDGDDPNTLTEDISGLYADLEVVSQTRYIYDGFGRLWQTWVAVSDSVFGYDEPNSWYGTQIVYDGEGRQIQHIEDVNGLSLTTTYEYDRQGQRIKTTYPDGHWQKQVHNGRGLEIETIEGYGPEYFEPNDYVIRQTVYDADGHVFKELLDGQVTTSYEIDELGRVFRQYQGDFTVDPCSYTEYARNLAGDVLSQTTVQVDAQHNETVISQTQNQYNVLGQRFEQRQLADANGEPNDLTDRITLTSYDVQGRRIETLTKGPGNSLIYVNTYSNAAVYQVGDAIEQTWYDVSGNPTYHIRLDCQEICYSGSNCTIPMPFEEIDEVFQYAKTHQKIVLERFDYDDGKQSGKAVLAGFDPNDPNWLYQPQAGLIWRQTETVDYDPAGRVEKKTDADDNFTTFRYNSRNQQTEQTVWQGRPILRWRDLEDDPNFIAYPVRKTLAGYDVAGRQSRTALLLDPNGSATIQSVDLALDRVTDFVYDEYGRLYRQRQYFDGENKRIAYLEYAYDSFSRIGVVEHGELEEAFWPGGGLLSETKTVQKTVVYGYNAQHQIAQQTAMLVNTATEQTTSIDSFYGYDTAGRLIQTDNAAGTTLVVYYDALGRKIKQTDATNKVVQYVYNDLGDLAWMIEDPAGLNRQTGYTYNRFGRQTAIWSGSNHTDYAYDSLGNVERIDYPNGNWTSYGYNALSQVIRRTISISNLAATTQYKRDNLGRICFKQYVDDPNWSDPNEWLPFDEILYDALGNKQMVIFIDDSNDMELNAYAYDGHGNLTAIDQAAGNFYGAVVCSYDQRGQMTQITYPDEEIVSYTHDASGRIRTVDFNDRTLVEYDYLGELVIGKTLPNAGLQYATTVDTLGRMTGETYSRPATSQTIWTAAYEHLNHSDRLIERSGIDYGFDTLGRVISEDSTSYLCDNLGNPTDAGEDGLSYLLDSEQQIKQVDNTSGTVAVYGYDRIGRRVQKTIGTSEVRFIYDPFGRMIAEYVNGEWVRDYVYGASGEAVYMRFPKTDEVIAAETNFWGFINAWLCSPYCTQDDLAWDTNADSQINFIDWAADSNAFTGAFTINERFLLADSRNSVIGKVNLDSSVDLIAYTAFGAPYYAQGTDLEGLAILWNGYYFDYETGNYYLRNRYYSPLERRFLTPDPHGVNPDGNWNNPFGVFQQYSDGFGLQVYAQGDPVDNRDDWGLMGYKLGTSDPAITNDPGAGAWNSEPETWSMWLLKRHIMNNIGIVWVGMPDAANHLSHYLGNTGTDYTIRLQKMIDDELPAYLVYFGELNAAQMFVESLPNGTHSITSSTVSLGYNTESWNWYYAVGGYSAWGKGKAKRCNDEFELQFEYKFHDRYNWDTGKSVTILGVTVTDEFMGEFHRQGLAKEFNMNGSVKKTVKWKKGEIPVVTDGWDTGGRR